MLAAVTLTATLGLLISPARLSPQPGSLRVPSARMALDYKDPVVAEEFATVQTLSMDEVEDELAESGVGGSVTAAMNEIDIRLMLCEMRLRKAGKVGSAKKEAARPSSFGSEFERMLFEKPAFKELYQKWQKENNVNAVNLATEYLNNRKRCKERYGGTDRFEKTCAEIEEALNAKVVQVVKSARLIFSGFPSGMGEAGVRMTLEGFGALVDFSVEESDDAMTLTGRAEFETIDQAKAAIEKYDGVDMGLGTTLELQAL